MIEKVDCMVGKLAGADAVIFITGDHSTPVVKREHSFEPVPFLVHNAPARDYGCRKFSERECRKGELGIFTGDRIMRLVLAYTERIGKYGA